VKTPIVFEAAETYARAANAPILVTGNIAGSCKRYECGHELTLNRRKNDECHPLQSLIVPS